MVVEQHKETTTTSANATTSAVTIQQSEEAPQTSTLLPVLPTEPTSTLSLEGHESMTDTPSTINQPLELGSSLPAMSEEEILSLLQQFSNTQ